MKIVQIEDDFHPDAGYQINILSKYFSKEGHEVVILTAEREKLPKHLTTFFDNDDILERDAEYTRKYGVRIIRIPLITFVSGRAVFKREIFKIILREKPDVLYIHGNDTLIGIQCIYKYHKAPFRIVTDSHMLEMASQNRFNRLFRWWYKHFCTPIIVKNSIPVIRTQNDMYVKNCLGIPLELAPWISFGSDTLLFHPDDDVRMDFRKNNDIDENDFVILYAGKLNESKGGMLLADAIQKKFETKRNIVFVIVGSTSGDYGDRVEKRFRESGNRVLRFPTQKYEDLAYFYKGSDVSIFPRQCSLSFYDVQACGLPVLLENNNINMDRVSHNNGICFESESVESLRNMILQIADLSNEELKTMKSNCLNFIRSGYDYASIADQYLKVICK